MADRMQPFKVVCGGGLILNENSLLLSDQLPGSATRLINFETSMYGGYRRINGFAPLDENYPGIPGEGPVLGVHIFKGGCLAARKDIGSSETYSVYYNALDGDGWEDVTPDIPPDVTGVRTVHFNSFYWYGDVVIMCDGTNDAMSWDGSTWTILNADYNEDPTSPNAPKRSIAFNNHMFFCGMEDQPDSIIFSAPLDYTDFTPGAGAGIIDVGFKVVSMAVWRNNLFIFGQDKIKKLTGQNASNYVLETVTDRIGCIAPNSIVEVGGDLFFLANDGIRTIAGTERIGDVELATISRRIRVIFETATRDFDMELLNVALVRSKSQFRYFFTTETMQAESGYGLIACLTGDGAQTAWEFGELLGIQSSCAHSAYIGDVEYVIHGDNEGRIHRQEQGYKFDGRDVFSIYETPFLDMGDTEIRKIFHSISVFIRPEGHSKVTTLASYDWYDPDVAFPRQYSMESKGVLARYRDTGAIYGEEVFTYGGADKPVLRSPIEGSGYAVSFRFITSASDRPFTLLGFTVQFSYAGRR